MRASIREIFRHLVMAPAVQGLRCLCLHGKGSSGPTMLKRMSRIVEALPEVTFLAPTSPIPLDDDSGQWWRLAPGERSFTATEFIDLETSIDFLRDYHKAHGPFDVVWGHSQGAILIAAMLATPMLDEIFSPMTKCILNGAAWPAPFNDALNDASPSLRSSLHCVGATDTVNPPDHALRIAKIFSGDVFQHPGGHVIPDDDDAIAMYRSFLLSQ